MPNEAEVYCPVCGWIPTQTTDFINIEEDISGRDVMTFRCPEGIIRKSLIRSTRCWPATIDESVL